MQFKEILAKVQSSSEFKDWFAKYSDSVLAHIFFTDDGKGINSYDVGYYNPKEDKMASFEVTSNVLLKDYSEVFKEPGKTVKALEIEHIKIKAKEALQKAEEVQKEKYPSAKPYKKIIILQHLDIGQVWNITYVTQTFETLNIKIASDNGKLLEDKMSKIFSMEQGAGGKKE